MTPLLTIAIPTFNRPQALERSLRRLLPQLTADCELLVIDNASDLAAEAIMAGLPRGPDSGSVRIVRNPYNIGGGGNVLRCFEAASGAWIWVVGDDDLPHDNAVALVLRDVRRQSGTVFLNYASDVCTLVSRVQGIPNRVAGLGGLIAACDSFSNLLFISSGVYSRAILPGTLAKAYPLAGSYAPHLCLLFIHLRTQGGESVFMSESLVTSGKRTHTGGWDSSYVMPRLVELLTIIPDSSSRSQLGKLIMVSAYPHPVPLRSYLLLAAGGELAGFSSLMSDELLQYRAWTLVTGRPRFRSVLRWLCITVIFCVRTPLRILGGPILRSRRHPGVPIKDSVARLLDDTRI